MSKKEPSCIYIACSCCINSISRPSLYVVIFVSAFYHGAIFTNLYYGYITYFWNLVERLSWWFFSKYLSFCFVCKYYIYIFFDDVVQKGIIALYYIVACHIYRNNHTCFPRQFNSSSHQVLILYQIPFNMKIVMPLEHFNIKIFWPQLNSSSKINSKCSLCVRCSYKHHCSAGCSLSFEESGLDSVSCLIRKKERAKLIVANLPYKGRRHS